MDPSQLYWESTYQKTGFLIPKLNVEVRIGFFHAAIDQWLQGNRSNACAIITAWNPMSELANKAYNLAANDRLLASLTQYKVMDALGVPDEGEWEAEESFLVGGISLVEATLLAREFKQRAFVFAPLHEKALLVWP